MKAKVKQLINRLARILLPDWLVDVLSSAWREGRLRRRNEQEQAALLENRAKRIPDYLHAHPVRRLQVGAGDNSLGGWLNADLEPSSDGVIFLDATRPFPFDDHTFDYVFSEHMIEHITYRDALFMLKECFRVLRPGGKIRIATPDVEQLAGLFTDEPDEIQRRYLELSATEILGLYSDELSPIQKHLPEWALNPEHIRRQYPSPGRDTAAFTVNHFFRSYDHRFLFDRTTLSGALAEAGFQNIRFCTPGVSDDPELSGLESHSKQIGEEMNRFETMVAEADSPVQTGPQID